MWNHNGFQNPNPPGTVSEGPERVSAGHYRMSGTGASPGSVCPCTDSWVLRAFGSDSWVWRALGSVPLALSLAASGGVFFAGGPSGPRHCWRRT